MGMSEIHRLSEGAALTDSVLLSLCGGDFAECCVDADCESASMYAVHSSIG